MGFWEKMLRGIGDNAPNSYYGALTYGETITRNDQQFNITNFDQQFIVANPQLPPFGNINVLKDKPEDGDPADPIVFYYEDFDINGDGTVDNNDIQIWSENGRDDIVDAIYHFIATQNWPPPRPPAPTAVAKSKPPISTADASPPLSLNPPPKATILKVSPLFACAVLP